MAITVELRKSAADTLDLSGGTDGFYILRDGWIQRQARREEGEYQSVFESMTLTLSATSHNDLASKIQTLNVKMEEVKDYIKRSVDVVHLVPIYLRARLNNETEMRRAVLYELAAEPNHDLNSPPVSPDSYVPSYLLTMERHPFWESPSATMALLFPSTGSISVIGGEKPYETSMPGDVPVRLGLIEFEPTSTGYTLSDVWMGYRTSKYGDRDDFNPNYDLGDADAELHTDTALVTGVSSAYNNTAARVSMSTGTATVEPRVTLRLADIINWNIVTDQGGTHIALLRARHTSTGDIFRARLLHGFYDGSGANDDSKWVSSALAQVPASGVTAGNFYYYDMGLIDIPPSRAAKGWGKSVAFRIEAGASSTSGGGYLDLDMITLIPASEGAISVKGGNIVTTSGVDNELFVYTTVDDIMFASTEVGTGSFVRTCEFTPHNWGMPTGSGMYVVAAQRAYQSNKNDSIGVDGLTYSRWLTLAGNP